MKQMICILTVLIVCSALVFAQTGQDQEKDGLKPAIVPNTIAAAKYTGPFPLPMGIEIGFSRSAFDTRYIQVPEGTPEMARKAIELVGILKAPEKELPVQAPGAREEEEPAVEEPAPAPRPRQPSPGVPVPTEPEEKPGEAKEELGPPWTIEKCDKYLGGRCFEGYVDLPDSCKCGGPITPTQNCAACDPNKPKGAYVCVDKNGKIKADAGCVAGGVQIEINNQNNGAKYTVTSKSDGSFELDTSKEAMPAKPGHVLSLSLATGTSAGSTGTTVAASASG